MFSIFYLLVLFPALQGAKLDDKNITVECSFTKLNSCFAKIASLGGNLTSIYAEKNKDLNRTCAENVSPNSAFLICLNAVPTSCSQNAQQPAILKIEKFVKNLCKNGSVEQTNFLNSSLCYNKNINKRQSCVQKYANYSTDAKSKCCQVKKIQDCVKNEMPRACSKNSTDFQNNLMTTYSSYTDALCVQYNQHCGAATTVLSLACLLLAVKTTLFSWWEWV